MSSTLVDFEIIQRQEQDKIITPFSPANVEPASYDLTIGDEYYWSVNTGLEPGSIDLATGETQGVKGQHVTNRERMWIKPNEFILATTVETVHMPADLLARLEGKSTLARQGLIVHVTAGFIDPGFQGKITLELKNISPHNLVLHQGMRIGQLVFEPLDHPAQHPYGSDKLNSHYQGQTTVTPARISA